MKVANLQQHLADLARMLDASGAGKAIVTDLNAISERLSMFRDMPLRAFADFLVAAEDAVRKGDAIGRDGKAPKPPREQKPKSSVLNVADVAARVKQIYDQAANPAITEEQINKAMADLGKLTKANVVKVLTEINMKAKGSDTKENIVNMVRRWIMERQGKSERAMLGKMPPSTQEELPTSH